MKSNISEKKSNNQSGRGGPRSGAGRKPNAHNKRTKELVAQAEAGGIMPLDYMLSVMRDSRVASDMRLDAAKSSAPYVHAKLSSIEVNAHITAHEASLDDLA